MKVIKKNLIENLSTRMNCSKQIADLMIVNLFDVIFEELGKGNKVILPKVGVMSSMMYTTGKAGNLHGAGTIMIPAKLKLKIVGSKFMKAKLEELRKVNAMENTSLFLM